MFILQVFASCCSVLRNIWSGAACVSWWARGLAGRVVARAAAAAPPSDAAHTRAAVAAVCALDDLVQAAPHAAREYCLPPPSLYPHLILLQLIYSISGTCENEMPI